MSDDKKRVARDLASSQASAFYIEEHTRVYENLDDCNPHDAYIHVREVLPIDEDLEKVIKQEANNFEPGHFDGADSDRDIFAKGARFGLSLQTPKLSEHKAAHVRGYGTIPWSVHERAWEAYAVKYGRQQSAERIVERGGFSKLEMDLFHPNWREESSEIAGLKRKLSESERLAPGVEWVTEFLRDRSPMTVLALTEEALRQGIKLKGDKP